MPERIGKYQIKRELGKGATGTVSKSSCLWRNAMRVRQENRL